MVQSLRKNFDQKTKVMNGPVNSIDDLPLWGFDGSSTNQAAGDDSDCMLKPVYKVPDPIRAEMIS